MVFDGQDKPHGACWRVRVEDGCAEKAQEVPAFIPKIKPVQQAAIVILQLKDRAHEDFQLPFGPDGGQVDKQVNHLSEFPVVSLVDQLL